MMGLGYGNYDDEYLRKCLQLCPFVSPENMKSVDGIYEMYLRDLQGILNYCTKGFEKVALAELERLGLDVKDLALEEINKLINYIVSGQKNKPENKEECERSVLEWRELMRKKEDK